MHYPNMVIHQIKFDFLSFSYQLILIIHDIKRKLSSGGIFTVFAINIITSAARWRHNNPVLPGWQMLPSLRNIMIFLIINARTPNTGKYLS